MQANNEQPSKVKRSLSVILHKRWHKIKGISKTKIQSRKIDEELENLLQEIDYLTRNKSYISNVVDKDCRGVPLEDVVNFQQNSRILIANHNQPISFPNTSKLPCHIVEFCQQPRSKCVCKPCPIEKGVSTDPPGTNQRTGCLQKSGQQTGFLTPEGNQFNDQTYRPNQDRSCSCFQPTVYSSPTRLPDNARVCCSSQPANVLRPPNDWTMVDTPGGCPKCSYQDTRNILQYQNCTMPSMFTSSPAYPVLQQNNMPPHPIGQRLNNGQIKWLDCSAVQTTETCSATGACGCCDKKTTSAKMDSSLEGVKKICVQSMDAISDAKTLANYKFSTCMKKECPCTILTEQQLRDRGIMIEDIKTQEDDHKKSKEKKETPKKKKEKKKCCGCFSCCKKKKKKEDPQRGAQVKPVTVDKTQQVPTKPMPCPECPNTLLYQQAELGDSDDLLRLIIKPLRKCEPLCQEECAKKTADTGGSLTVSSSLKEFIKKNAKENSEYMENILNELRQQRKELQKINKMYENCIRNFEETTTKRAQKAVYCSVPSPADKSSTKVNEASIKEQGYPLKKANYDPICKCYNDLGKLKQFKKFPNSPEPYAAQYVVSTQWMYIKGDPKQIKNIVNESRLLCQPSNLLERNQSWSNEDMALEKYDNRNRLIIRQLRNAATSTDPQHSNKKRKLELALVWIKHSVNSLRKKRRKKTQGNQTTTGEIAHVQVRGL